MQKDNLKHTDGVNKIVFVPNKDYTRTTHIGIDYRIGCNGKVKVNFLGLPKSKF